MNGKDRKIVVSWIFYNVWRRLRLPVFLDSPLSPVWPGMRPSSDISVWAGWGYKRSGRHAMRMASKQGIDCLLLEDGFLRSIGVGMKNPPMSIVVDDEGMYYDANRPSRLERLIGHDIVPAEAARARELIAAWRKTRVSKYNHLREYVGALPERYVLVADQTFGDNSILFGMADDKSFHRMLEAALDENPDCTILVKIHPAVFAGLKKGHYDPVTLSKNPRVVVLGDDVHPVKLIEGAEAVYTVTSQIGFEGLIHGKPVRTFGMPFYGGWRLTLDDLPAPGRRRPVTLENLAHAALVAYPRYLDPETGERCEPERLIEWMGLQRMMRERLPESVCAVNFSRWKKPIVRDYFKELPVHFVDSMGMVPNGSTALVWGKTVDRAHSKDQIKSLCVEDGFLRSVGLGADKIHPLSLVMDSSGIYYDSTQPSDLEHILQTELFDAALVSRAAALRERIVSSRLTKYNVGNDADRNPLTMERGKKPVILVPGQVESDASIRYGSPLVTTNMDLLKKVREERPDAYIIYKPHPDVLAGLRERGRDEEKYSDWCDKVIVDCNIADLFDLVDEIHTMTSLAGFEALLRWKKVVTYGQPFYSGWGLTKDLCPLARRSRCLTLDELVAGALILYPVYLSRASGRYTTPERALDELAAWRRDDAGRHSLSGYIKKLFRLR
jgi:capsular polysaccharide export protein